MNPNATLPLFQGEQGTRFIHKEFIGDIKSGPTLLSGSTSFDVATYDLNPSNAALFPWLSRIAHLYDQWIPNGLVFEFQSTSSEFNGVGQSLGAVILSTDYDPYDLPPASKQIMENSQYAVSSRPCDSVRHGLECAVSSRPTPILYTSSQNGAPLTSVDLGKFSIATKGMAAAEITLGELWVSYDITFLKKQIDPVVSGSLLPYYRADGITLPGDTTNGYFAGLDSIKGTTPKIVRDISLPGSEVVGLTFDPTMVGRSFLVIYTGATTAINTQVQIADFAFKDGITVTSQLASFDENTNYIFAWTIFCQTLNQFNNHILISANGTESASVVWSFSMSEINPEQRVNAFPVS
jgi:hypothetical protein